MMALHTLHAASDAKATAVEELALSMVEILEPSMALQ